MSIGQTTYLSPLFPSQPIVARPTLSAPTALFGFTPVSASLNQADSTSFRQLQGIPSTTNSIFSSASALGQNLVSRLVGLTNQYIPASVLAPLKWTTGKIVDAAKSVVGSQFRMESLAYGRLACAWAASTILKNAGLIDRKVAGCESLKEVLKDNNFKATALDNRSFNANQYHPGDVVFFAKGPSGHGHVGVISKVEKGLNGTAKVYMTHNSTSDREVKEIVLNNYNRYPNAIYRA